MRRPCIDCGKVIERGSRCRRCEARRRGTTTEQAAYLRRVLASTGGRCARCGSGQDVEAHHLEPLGEGGDRRGLGIPLCQDCHRLAHRAR
jgi:predicted HNH restriction endonuclease